MWEWSAAACNLRKYELDFSSCMGSGLCHFDLVETRKPDPAPESTDVSG